jgi:hypothetical protein
MLSAVVSGMDSKGDAWTLRLLGPGTLNVTKQDDASGNPTALTDKSDINTITIGGTDPLTSRIVGTVTPGPGSDGRVFFNTMTELPSFSQQFSGSGLGLLSIDMPNFWLGNTTPSGSTTTPTTPTVALPDGVDTLRFGGVDTTFNQPAATSSTTSNVYTVTLGLPLFGGTRILIDRSVSSTQSVPPTTGTTPTIAQHAVFFTVAGRLRLFQANEIDGDANNPPGQFQTTPNSNNTATGGTWLDAATANTPPFFTTNNATGALSFKGPVTGAIGDVRIGGNATNFSTVVVDSTGSGNARLANYSIGGETTNILLVAPNGARNLYFGKGMDTASILAHVVNVIQANRGALNSNVYVDRSISRINLGGDAVNTNVLSGVNQNFTNILNTVTGQSSSGFSSTPAVPPQPLNAQQFGGMTVHVAGNVTNSVFAASVQPDTSSTPPVFGNSNQLVLTGGHISAKVEGTINNSTATPDSPKTAFYAQHVSLLSGPVVPPNVPEPPYKGTGLPSILPGISLPQTQSAHGSTATTAAHASASPARSAASLANHAKPSAVTVGKSTPKGPAKK